MVLGIEDPLNITSLKNKLFVVIIRSDGRFFKLESMWMHYNSNGFSLKIMTVQSFWNGWKFFSKFRPPKIQIFDFLSPKMVKNDQKIENFWKKKFFSESISNGPKRVSKRIYRFWNFFPLKIFFWDIAEPPIETLYTGSPFKGTAMLLLCQNGCNLLILKIFEANSRQAKSIGSIFMFIFIANCPKYSP